MKKFLNYFLAFIMLFSCGIFFVGCKEQTPKLETSNNIQNLVGLIGDGMVENHIENAKIEYGISSLEFENDYKCKVNTSSKTLLGPTDSAAAATAMATGQSVKNKAVSKDGDKDIQTILEYASSKGMKTGVVTTDKLSGATPACFSSHAHKRGDTLDILNGQTKSNIDLFIGASSGTYSENASSFRENGYTFVENINSIYNTNLMSQTDFSEIVEFATSFLENENGFVLMVECAHIDKFSHDKKLMPALAEVRTLFDTANKLYAYDKAHGSNTAIIITADHETGRLALASSKENLTKYNNNLFKKSGHSETDVNLYVHNVSFISDTKRVKNTFVYTISKFVIDNRKTA